MNKKITIRDVAQAAGVSISTVHQALNDKPGVSDATREHIRMIADNLGYRPNKMASGLKRRTQHIAVLLPDESGHNRFYYPPLWQGVRDYLKSSEDLNVECREFRFPNEVDPASSGAVEQVRALLAEDKLDGLLTVGHLEALSRQEWQHVRDSGVAPAVGTAVQRTAELRGHRADNGRADLQPYSCVRQRGALRGQPEMGAARPHRAGL